MGQRDAFVECLGGHAVALPGGKDAQHQPTNLLSMMKDVWLFDQVHRLNHAMMYMMCPISRMLLATLKVRVT